MTDFITFLRTAASAKLMDFYTFVLIVHFIGNTHNKEHFYRLSGFRDTVRLKLKH